ARQQFQLVGDEHTPHIKLDPTLPITVEEVEGLRAGHEGKCGVFMSAFGPEMHGQCWFVELDSDAAVKIGVVLGLDLGLRLGPERGAISYLGRFAVRLVDDRNGYRNVPGLRLDDVLDAVTLGVYLGVLH